MTQKIENTVNLERLVRIMYIRYPVYGRWVNAALKLDNKQRPNS
jgi:hypothetical protein